MTSSDFVYSSFAIYANLQLKQFQIATRFVPPASENVHIRPHTFRSFHPTPHFISSVDQNGSTINGLSFDSSLENTLLCLSSKIFSQMHSILVFLTASSMLLPYSAASYSGYMIHRELDRSCNGDHCKLLAFYIVATLS